MKETRPLKCGFCSKEVDLKEWDKKNKGILRAKNIIACPYCNAILGIYGY